MINQPALLAKLGRGSSRDIAYLPGAESIFVDVVGPRMLLD